jgi:hypothetical protein
MKERNADGNIDGNMKSPANTRISAWSICLQNYCDVYRWTLIRCVFDFSPGYLLSSIHLEPRNEHALENKACVRMFIFNKLLNKTRSTIIICMTCKRYVLATFWCRDVRVPTHRNEIQFSIFQVRFSKYSSMQSMSNAYAVVTPMRAV